MPVETQCSYCGAAFKVSPYKLSQKSRFCSNQCRYDGLRRDKTEPCDFCGKSVTRRQSSFRRGGATQVFCDRSCSTRWRSANPSATKMYYHSKSANRFRKLYKTRCFICGFDRVIELCHIISSKDDGTIHPDNIVTLCPNHHTLMDRGLLTKEEDDMISHLRLLAKASPYSTRFRRRRRS